MPRIEHDYGASIGFYVAGVYRRLQKRELDRISQLDPRLFLEAADDSGLVHDPADTAILNDAALMAGTPIVVPRWMLGGHTIPEVRDWQPYSDRMVREFSVSADDLIRPA